MISSTAPWTVAASVTSAATAVAVTPSASTSAMVSAAALGSRTSSTTSLPASANALTSARPIPRFAPVTTDTLPDIENASSTDIYCSSWVESKSGRWTSPWATSTAGPVR